MPNCRSYPTLKDAHGRVSSERKRHISKIPLNLDLLSQAQYFPAFILKPGDSSSISKSSFETLVLSFTRRGETLIAEHQRFPTLESDPDRAQYIPKGSARYYSIKVVAKHGKPVFRKECFKRHQEHFSGES